jgi:hypothetical protein
MLRLWSNKAMNPPDSASLRPRVMAGVSPTIASWKVETFINAGVVAVLWHRDSDVRRSR